MKFSDWGMEVVTITPDYAAQALLDSEGYNPRQLATTKVHEYARDMLAGKWQKRTSAPMARDSKGRFRNGFHRLRAVVESGVTIEQIVINDTTPEEVKSFDIGKNRGHHVALDVPKKEIAIVNSLRKYTPGEHSYAPTTVFENERALKVYRPDLNWLQGIEPRTPYNDATTEAVIVRARHNGVSSKLLELFIRGLREDHSIELSTNRLDICTKLRRYLSSTDSNSEKARQERTEKVEYALKKFLADEPIQRLFGVSETDWPVTRIMPKEDGYLEME